jgi:para-nitrobenzyl esterase
MKATRRNFIQTLGIGAIGLTIPKTSLGNTQAHDLNIDEDQLLHIGDNIAIAQTEYGKVRGFILRGIHQFLGIPYGADTSGKNRFMPPQKPVPWNDIKPTIWWGNSAPQIMEKRYANAYSSFVDHWNYDDVSEDCLKLNIWTPALDKANRPVIVWLHGGGFVNGNGIEQDGYHGENLSRMGNIVFCSVNHRLGALGYCCLSSVGGPLASGNAGNLDLVASLEWIKNNISQFGGDPNNVTIIGQSGGGAKVTTLMNMPAAKGLFHKAVALSGSSLIGVNKDYAEKLGAKVLEEAGFKIGEFEKLQQMPWLEFIQIANRTVAKFSDEAKKMGIQREGFSPVSDGIHLSSEPFFSGGMSENIPLMLNTTIHEWTPSRSDASLEKVTWEEITEKLSTRFGEKSSLIVSAYKKQFPTATAVEIWALILSNRKNAVAAADAKSKNGKAPVYVSWFGWQPPLFDGRMRAFHCIDICFWFYNTDLMFTHTGGGKRPRALSTKMANSFIQFVKTGNPNGGGLPEWLPYSAEKGETMILDDLCLLQNNPDGEARKSLD